jgi:hypothetical protein
MRWNPCPTTIRRPATASCPTTTSSPPTDRLPISFATFRLGQARRASDRETRTPPTSAPRRRCRCKAYERSQDRSHRDAQDHPPRRAHDRRARDHLPERQAPRVAERASTRHMPFRHAAGSGRPWETNRNTAAPGRSTGGPGSSSTGASRTARRRSDRPWPAAGGFRRLRAPPVARGPTPVWRESRLRCLGLVVHCWVDRA